MDLARPIIRLLSPAVLVPTLSLAVIGLAASVHGGFAGLGQQRAVGGVMIDAAGVVRTATADEKRELSQIVAENLMPAKGDLNEATELRMVSLSGLQDALMASVRSGKPIAADVEFLAGLQQIDYIFVDESKRDIVIAGPAEPWKMLDDGSVVGTVTGGATMRLVDLLVAMRSVETARNGGISCSIEPTPEGRRRLQTMLRRVKLRPGDNPVALEASMKEAFGPQLIQLTGVPADSRYARTMVAADFEMKRVAMGLAPSPVAGLPSYLEMARNASHGGGQNPRWWMACDYEAMAKSDDGLAWKLSGGRVKTMTEQDLVSSDGTVAGAGKTDKLAQAWADKMTAQYDEIAKQVPVFADLKNVMDLTVVATLIVQEGLAEKAGVDLDPMSGSDSVVELASYAVPRSVDPQCSFIHGRSGWVVTASGGVDINAFSIVQNQTVVSSVAEVKTAALAAAADRWWWNQ